MAGGVTIGVEGLDKLIKKFGKIPENVATAIDAELADAALNFQTRAANEAPVNYGVLKNSITMKQVRPMEYEVVSGAHYSAYVEFGTRSSVRVPAELQAYAAQFKRSNGEGVGMKARPFFFKQMPLAQQQLKQKLTPAIQAALNK
jgi:HK97 gp10 family phage protein